MKRFVLLLTLAAAISAAPGQGLDDEYVQIFKLIQEADTLSTSAPGQALAKYREAQVALDRLHKGSPDWNTRIVDYRLSYLANRIATLSNVSSPAPPQQGNEAKPSASATASKTTPADWQAQAANLNEQVQRLQADNGLLQAKLKEALSLRPAQSDPAELAKAEDKIKALQKENDLLRVSRENPSTPAIDPKALDQARQSLADANRKLEDQTARSSKLALEKEALESRLKTANSETAAVAGLRTENQLLKQKLAELQAAPPPSTKTPETVRATTEAQTQLAKLQSDNETLRLEKLALENRVKQLSGGGIVGDGATAGTAASADNSRIKQLEAERDQLQTRLDSALKDASGRKGKAGSARAQDLENQLALTRTRLEVFEARAVPYSPEELALLKRPEPRLTESDHNGGKKSIKELPPGSKALVAEAQRCFAAKQYDQAEAAYLKVLQQDPKNVPTLANLAAIQVEAEHLDKADSNIKQALAQDPEDAYSLYVLGILRFRQAKYDDALDALSHSAKLDPQNAEVQNYLGLALSEKGMRVPAEAALRRAVQLQPGYAGAHYNLAVVYATQQPPATELARWHYQKALAAGHPRNPDLEKKFERRQ